MHDDYDGSGRLTSTFISKSSPRNAARPRCEYNEVAHNILFPTRSGTPRILTTGRARAWEQRLRAPAGRRVAEHVTPARAGIIVSVTAQARAAALREKYVRQSPLESYLEPRRPSDSRLARCFACPWITPDHRGIRGEASMEESSWQDVFGCFIDPIARQEIALIADRSAGGATLSVHSGP